MEDVWESLREAYDLRIENAGLRSEIKRLREALEGAVQIAEYDECGSNIYHHCQKALGQRQERG